MNRWLPKNKALNLILVGALFAVLSIEFVLVDIPELFPGGAKIGFIVHALSLAYIASYIFYVVVVHVKHVRDREQIHPYIVRLKGPGSMFREICVQ